MLDMLKNKIGEAFSSLGVEEYEVFYLCSADCSVGTLNGEVNSFSSGECGTIYVRALVDGKMGCSSTELFTEEEMGELAHRAYANAKAIDKIDTVGFFKGAESYEEMRMPEYTSMGAGELRRLAGTMAEALYKEDPSVKDGTSTTAATASYHYRLMNSHGLDLECQGGINLVLGEAVIEKDGESQAEYAIRVVGENAVCEIAEEAVGGALAKVGADTVPSGSYDIIFSGKQMRSLLSVYASAFSSKKVLDGVSPLKDKEGEKIAADIVTITDDPQREGNMCGINFDMEGVPTHRRAVVENGVLKTLLYNRETALKMGKESTGNAGRSGGAIDITNYSFCIEPGDKSLDELFSMAEGGIYITDIKGLHAGANPVTGDFSLESEGFLIEGGRLGKAVKSFTVAGNFYELLTEIHAISDKLYRGVQTGFSGFGSADVLVKGMSVAGK